MNIRIRKKSRNGNRTFVVNLVFQDEAAARKCMDLALDDQMNAEEALESSLEPDATVDGDQLIRLCTGKTPRRIAENLSSNIRLPMPSTPEDVALTMLIWVVHLYCTMEDVSYGNSPLIPSFQSCVNDLMGADLVTLDDKTLADLEKSSIKLTKARIKGWVTFRHDAGQELSLHACNRAELIKSLEKVKATVEDALSKLQ